MKNNNNLNILLLHNMGPKKYWFSGVEDVELLFKKYDKENFYFVHNCFSNFPRFLNRFKFDSIIMMSTFMDKVTTYGIHSKWIKQFEFIKNSSAIKIVFAQDDYNFCEIRDEFYTTFKINKVLPIVSKKYWHDLMPNFINQGGKVEQGFTTYVTPKMIELINYEKEFSLRKFDVVYRAKKNPTTPNHYGYIKGIIGDKFIQQSKKTNLKLDISTNPKKLIRGDKWYSFISNSRCILGSNSGSSVKMRNMNIFKKIKNFEKKNKQISNEEIQKSILKKEDRNKAYTCLSPRNIESAMIGTLQILVEGEYGNIIKPFIDYIPVKEDCRNLNEILDLINDHNYCKKVIKNCRERLLNEDSLNYSNVISNNISFIRENISKNYYKRSNRYFYFLLHLLYCKIFSFIKELAITFFRFIR